MKTSPYSRLCALALALLVSTSLFAGIDQLAVSEVAAPTWATAPATVQA